MVNKSNLKINQSESPKVTPKTVLPKAQHNSVNQNSDKSVKSDAKPKSKNKVKKLGTPNNSKGSATINLSNRFSILSENPTQSNNSKNKADTQKVNNPPPIHLPNICDIKPLTKMLGCKNTTKNHRTLWKNT